MNDITVVTSPAAQTPSPARHDDASVVEVDDASIGGLRHFCRAGLHENLDAFRFESSLKSSADGRILAGQEAVVFLNDRHSGAEPV